LSSGGKKSVQLWGSIESRLRTEAKTNDRIDFRYNARVQSVDQDNDSTWVMTDGGEIFHADILIGADGHRSIVRRRVAPHKPNATFAGFIVWIAAVDEIDLPEYARPPSQSQGVTMLDGGIDGFLFGSILDRQNGSSATGNR